MGHLINCLGTLHGRCVSSTRLYLHGSSARLYLLRYTHTCPLIHSYNYRWLFNCCIHLSTHRLQRRARVRCLDCRCPPGCVWSSWGAEDTGDGAAPPEPPPATALHHSWGMVMVRPSFRVSAIPYTIHLHSALYHWTNTGLSVQINWLSNIFGSPIRCTPGWAEIAVCEQEGSTIIPTHSQFGVLDWIIHSLNIWPKLQVVKTIFP